MTTTILPTRNEAYGFFGTMQLAGADPMQSWTAASAMIAAETDASPRRSATSSTPAMAATSPTTW